MRGALFRGGIHPDGRRGSASGATIEPATIPSRLAIPLAQSLGAPCEPLVAVGESVRRGQMIGDVRAKVSAPVHSPVDGTVVSIEPVLTPFGKSALAVLIEAALEQDLESWVPVREDPDPLEVACSAGLVGLGGAAFPTRVKLDPPSDTRIGTVVVNGCECEPYLACDHRLMVEHADRVVAGGRMIADFVGAGRVVVAIEDDKPEAVRAIRAEATGVEVRVLPSRYPQGAEKQLIRSVTGVEVPHGRLPFHVGVLVHNVGTVAALWEAFALRKPLFERVVTVAGAVVRPGNYLTAIGTSVRDLIAHAGGPTSEAGDRVIAGGPMMGHALGSLDVPVVKGLSGIVVLRAGETAPAVFGDQPCIRCARCWTACPMMLEPHAIGIRANVRDWDACESLHALDCIECGCCAYVCPSRRPLVQLIRAAKARLLVAGRSP